MLKRTRVGLIVWGMIIIFFGIMFLCLSAEDKSWLIVGGIITAGGLGLLVPGIILAIKVKVDNKRLIEENAGFSYVTTCPFCGRPVGCKIQDFRFHKRYPEGFVFCSICKHPISRSAFIKVQDYVNPN